MGKAGLSSKHGTGRPEHRLDCKVIISTGLPMKNRKANAAASPMTVSRRGSQPGLFSIEVKDYPLTQLSTSSFDPLLTLNSIYHLSVRDPSR